MRGFENTPPPSGQVMSSSSLASVHKRQLV
jgi:hypothetical protein